MVVKYIDVTTALMSMLIVPAHSSVKSGIKVKIRSVALYNKPYEREL